jgi:hypothetical protein
MVAVLSPSPAKYCVALNCTELKQKVDGEKLLRGLGAPLLKSPLLLSVSVQPLFCLRAALVLLKVTTGPLPSKQFAVLPKPTKSEMPAFGSGQVDPTTEVWGLVSTIFPDRPSDGIGVRENRWYRQPQARSTTCAARVEC